MIRTAYGPERARDNPDVEDFFADHIAVTMTRDGRFSDDDFGIPKVVRGITFTGDVLTASEDITALRGVLLQTGRVHRKFSDITRSEEVAERIDQVLELDPSAHDFSLMTSSFHGALRFVFGATYVEEVVETTHRALSAAQRQLAAR